MSNQNTRIPTNILKANETGFGYLIEHDAGYISPEDKRNLPFINEMKKLESGDRVITEPYYIYAVLQKYGVKNRNGRVYPEDILKKQVIAYQKLVDERRAIGELDHPDCHRKTAEIFTVDGWKLIKDVVVGEEVFTLNPDTNQIEVKPINKKIEQDFNGKLISIKGRNIDLQVTPNHKFWVIDRYGKGRFITALDIHEKKIKGLSKMYIPKIGDWVGESVDTFTIQGLDERELSDRLEYGRRLELMSDVIVPMDIWVKFMAIYLADGSVSASQIKKRKSMVTEDGIPVEYESPKSGYICKITQKKEPSKVLIRQLLELLPSSFREIQYPDGKVDFIINDARLHKYLKQFGKSHDKYVPKEIKLLNVELLNDFIDWFVLGDGRVRNNKYREVFSTSNKLIDDLNEIILKTGKSSNLRVEERNYERYFNDRIIKAGSSKPINRLHISTTKGIYLDSRHIKTEYVDYDDKIYCVNVDNHIFYVRDGGKSCWNGNSSVIAGDRVSHNIVEMWWEGNVLMGKLEILMTPGFINLGIASTLGDHVGNLLRHKIKIGVSSRGVGSVEDVHGVQLVQNDFELICWDVVTNPSTPGSWIFQDMNKSNEFKSEEINENKNNIIKGLDDFLLG